MPVYLPPISRRDFLKAAVLAGTAALTGQPFAAPAAGSSDFWLLLADTHIAADPKLVSRGVNMTDNLARVSQKILQYEKAPGGVLINGDCAFLKGEPEDYRHFTELLQPLREAGLPLHLTLGNHDSRAVFWDVLAADKTVAPGLQDRQVGLALSPRVNWFLLDSLEKTNSTPGFLGEEQRHWLAKELDARPDKPAIIVGHHNLEKGEAKSGLKDSELLLQILEPRAQVKAYVFGHTHHWELQKTPGGIHLINLPPVAYAFEKKDPSGWVEARVSSTGMELKLQSFDSAHPAHGRLAELAWR